MSEIINLKLDDIVYNKSDERPDFYDESIERLASSIKNDGLLSPITVCKREDGKYDLLFGERQDVNAIDVALGMKQIMDDENISQAELAKRLGYKQSTVANKIRLLKLPEYVQNAVRQGLLSERHARALLKVDEDKLEDVYLVIINRKYNVAKTEDYIKTLSKQSHIKAVGASAQIALNTFKKTFEDCKRASVDLDFNTREYEDYIKIEIKIKK